MSEIEKTQSNLTHQLETPLETLPFPITEEDFLYAVTKLQELIQISSLTEQESDIINHLQQTLTTLIKPQKNIHLERLGNNLVVEYVGNPEQQKFTTFVSHVDTVPFNAEEWQQAPLGGEIVDNKIYGRGSLDVKQGSAASLSLLHALTERPSPKNLRFVFYHGEETGTPNGASELFGEGLRLTPQNTDIAYVIEPSEGKIIHGAFGTVHLKIDLEGEAKHASVQRPDGKELILAGLIAEVVINLLEQVEKPAVTLGGNTFTTTLQPTLLEASGAARNITPSLASLTIDSRLAPGIKPAAIIEQVKQITTQTCQAYSQAREIPTVEPKFTILNTESSYGQAWEEIPASVKKLASTFGLTPRIEKFWSDVVTVGNAGIPAVNIGGGPIERAHTTDEYLTLDELAKFVSQCFFIAYGQN